MAHPVEQEEVMAYLDGELEAARAASVAAHLDECADCSELAAELRRVSQQMLDWQVESSPPRLIDAVASKIEHRGQQNKHRAAKERFLSEPEQRRWLPGSVRKTAAVLGVFLLIVFLSISTVRQLRVGDGSQLESFIRTEPAYEQKKAIPSFRAPDASSSAVQSSSREAAAVRAQPEAEKAAGPMVIRTATVVLVAKEFESARAVMERIVREHGGYLAQLTVTGHANVARTLTATLRVPAAQLDAVLAELKKLGRIEQESQSGEEVTQQYMDLVARLANARATEKRLIEVLRQRTGKVGDVLEVEREISLVRGEIERMEAQRKNMEKQVQFATLQFQLREDFQAKLEVTPPSTGTRMWNALAEGYHAAVETALGLVLLLLTAGPTLLLWLAILFWPARLVWRRMRPRFLPDVK